MTEQAMGIAMGVTVGVVGLVVFLLGFFDAPAWVELLIGGAALMKFAEKFVKEFQKKKP